MIISPKENITLDAKYSTLKAKNLSNTYEIFRAITGKKIKK